jgi:hypothetical protein
VAAGLTLALATAGGGVRAAGSYGTMYGQPVPTPLLIPPGFHARFLAQPVETTQLDGATFAYGGFWTVTTGYPATLEEVLPSGRVAVAVQLPGRDVYGAWAVAPGPDESVWVGTFHMGIVFRYSLATGQVQSMVRLPGVNTVWALAYDPQDGEMWAGTWPDGVWTIDPATGAARLVGRIPGEAGPHALGVAGGQVLAGAYPTMAVVDASAPGMPAVTAGATPLVSLLGGAGQVRYVGEYGGHTVVLGANGQLVWVGGGGLPYQTLSDCETLPFTWQGGAAVVRDGRIVAIQPGVPGRWNADNLPVGATLATLPPGKYWSAYGVVGDDVYLLASDGTLVRVAPGGAVSQSVPPLTASPGIIQTMAATPWGVFGSGYLGGDVWQLRNGQFARYTGLDQVDSIVACGRLMYLGVYPNARMYVYDPSQPWNPPDNPRPLGSPGYPQDRVPGIACVGTTAYMGTVPQNTLLGGAIYSSAGRTYPTPVAGETPVSLAADGADLVGSLSNQNALGTPRPALDAHLFLLDPASGRARTVDLGQRQTFAGVLVWNGQVYAASRQYLARWDPATGALSVHRFTAAAGAGGDWGFTTRMFALDGRLYLIDDGWLYLVNPATLAATSLFYGVQQVAVVGQAVYLAFYYARWLIEVPAADLVPESAAWPWNFWYDWRHDGHVWPPPPGWRG